MARTSAADVPHANEVRLVGRLAAPAEERALPSGDLVASWRLVIRRPDAQQGRRPSDTVDCSAFAPAVRRNCRGWAAGDTVEVIGALRRRFWRSGVQPVSRVDVLVERGRRVARAPEASD
jgi:single-strand DNA-binding protein